MISNSSNKDHRLINNLDKYSVFLNNNVEEDYCYTIIIFHVNNILILVLLFGSLHCHFLTYNLFFIQLVYKEVKKK